MMNYEEFIKSIMVKAEEDAFQKAKDDGQIQDAILIMHPKQKKFVIESGLHMLVLYTPACEEDKAYMVTDEKVCENIKRNLINDTIGVACWEQFLKHSQSRYTESEVQDADSN